MKMKKKEIFLFGAILVIAIAAMVFMNLRKDAVDIGSVRITVAGEEFGTYALNKDQKVKINGTNTLRIQDGKAWMIEASCPDHICMSQDTITDRGGVIVCLPNQVVVEGILPEGSTETQVDAVVQ